MATPAPVQHVVWSSTGSGETGGNTFKLPLANATLASNCLILAMQYPSGSTLSSITDNASNTWSTTPVATVTDGGNNMTFAVYAIYGATAGVTLLTITFSAAIQGFMPCFQEWYNVATSSPTDGNNKQVATTSPITSGSFSTGTAGDLILHFVTCTDNGTNNLSGNFDGLTKYTKNSGYTLLQVDLFNGYACQYLVQASAGATNPSLTPTLTAGAYSFPSITIALKSASAGTAPSASAMRIFGLYWCLMQGTGATGNVAYNVQFPRVGNLALETIDDQFGNINLVSISGSISGSWTVTSASSGDAQCGYKANATAGDTELLTYTINDVLDHKSIFGLFYDVVNGGAYDTYTKLQSNTSFGPGSTLPVSPITPGVSNGMVFAVMGVGLGPCNGVNNPSGAIYLVPVYTGQTDGSQMTNGDAWGYIAYTSNATQNWQFNDSVSSNDYDALQISFATGAAGIAVAWWT